MMMNGRRNELQSIYGVKREKQVVQVGRRLVVVVAVVESG